MKHCHEPGCAIASVQTVQTNRPNSSRLTAHQCPWLRRGDRPNNGCGRKAIDSEPQPGPPRRTISASGTFDIRAPNRAVPAPLRDSLQRAKSASDIFIRIASRQALVHPLARAARHRAGRDASEAHDGYGDSSDRPRPAAGRSRRQ